jgi:hypothetical protein
MFARLAMSAVVFSVVAAGSAPVLRAEQPKADPKQLEAQFEKLLDAYNKDDVKAFYTGWSKQVEAITTPEVYNALYKLNGKDVVGEYVPKTLKLRKETSVLDGEIIVVFFDAEFSKEKSGEVGANLMFEDGAYKFVQVQVKKK